VKKKKVYFKMKIYKEKDLIKLRMNIHIIKKVKKKNRIKKKLKRNFNLMKNFSKILTYFNNKNSTLLNTNKNKKNLAVKISPEKIFPKNMIKLISKTSMT
jgi:hypothetical protein